MTCRKSGCGYHFCWMCLKGWDTHGQDTGGYYKCNKFEQDKEVGKLSDEERRRAHAQNELKFYMHHFERYEGHRKGMIICKNHLADIEKKMERLQEEKGFKLGEVSFLLDAAEQVIECRRVLKNTYIYGFYLEHGDDCKPGSKEDTLRALFEMLQTDLERSTEHLHYLVEKSLDAYLDPIAVDKVSLVTGYQEILCHLPLVKSIPSRLIILYLFSLFLLRMVWYGRVHFIFIVVT